MSHVNIRIRDENELPSLEKREGGYPTQLASNIQRQDEVIDVELQKQRWKNRRRMAWLSLFTMIGVTALLLSGVIPETRIKVLSEPITWFYFAMTSVIGIYMGATTWASIKGK